MAPKSEAQSTGTADDIMVPRTARVRQSRLDGPDTWTLDLDDEAFSAGSYVPGQFNMMMAFGIGEVPISMSGDPSKPVLVHTVRAVGAVSAALTQLKPGDALGLRGPFGVGWPMAEMNGRDVVIVAGGVGLAPLRSLIYHLINERERYGDIVILYGTRSPDDILYRDELESWHSRFGSRSRGHRGSCDCPLVRACWLCHDTDPTCDLRSAQCHRARMRPGDYDALRRRRASGCRCCR